MRRQRDAERDAAMIARRAEIKDLDILVHKVDSEHKLRTTYYNSILFNLADLVRKIQGQKPKTETDLRELKKKYVDTRSGRKKSAEIETILKSVLAKLKTWFGTEFGQIVGKNINMKKEDKANQKAHQKAVSALDEAMQNAKNPRRTLQKGQEQKHTRQSATQLANAYLARKVSDDMPDLNKYESKLSLPKWGEWNDELSTEIEKLGVKIVSTITCGEVVEWYELLRLTKEAAPKSSQARPPRFSLDSHHGEGNSGPIDQSKRVVTGVADEICEKLDQVKHSATALTLGNEISSIRDTFVKEHTRLAEVYCRNRNNFSLRDEKWDALVKTSEMNERMVQRKHDEIIRKAKSLLKKLRNMTNLRDLKKEKPMGDGLQTKLSAFKSEYDVFRNKLDKIRPGAEEISEYVSINRDLESFDRKMDSILIQLNRAARKNFDKIRAKWQRYLEKGDLELLREQQSFAQETVTNHRNRPVDSETMADECDVNTLSVEERRALKRRTLNALRLA